MIEFAHLYVSFEGEDHTQAAVRPLEARSSGVCRISSPWIDIAVEREPVPYVRAIVRYSDRQMIADQAVMAGVRNVPTGTAVPIHVSEMRVYRQVFLKSRPGMTTTPPPPIEEIVPPDILWLFRNSHEVTRAPFGVAVGMENAMAAGAKGYTNIVTALIDQCLASDGADIQYNNVLDVSDLISLEQYKIIAPLD